MKRSEVCSQCFCLFEYTVGPGRPRVICDDCRNAGANAKVTPIITPCKVCKQDFSYLPRQGQPGAYCDNCKETDQLSINQLQRASRPSLTELVSKAKARVDNLEMMLRSRGTHISQQKSNY